MRKLLATTMLCITPLTFAQTQSCAKQSPDHTVALVELYTSEGCSSCPPADRAISALQKAADSDLVVPLALHVDYWDYIGWTDRFAKPDFTERQRWLTGLGGSRVVYTPEVFVAGRELRGWSGAFGSGIDNINRKPPQANIGIKLGEVSGNNLPVEVDTRAPLGTKLFVALYENGLSSNVKAGENSGVVLKHDFVVRDWLGPIVLNAAASQSSKTLTVPQNANVKQLGVAAFVQNGNGEVLQALALALCGS